MAAVAAKREVPKPDGWKWAIGVVAVMVLGVVAVRTSITPAPEEPSKPAAAAAPQSYVTYTDLPAGSTVAKNEGWLEVSAPNGTAVLVDGTERGRGSVHLAIASGAHDVKIGDRTRSIIVRDGKSAHADLTTP